MMYSLRLLRSLRSTMTLPPPPAPAQPPVPRDVPYFPSYMKGPPSTNSPSPSNGGLTQETVAALVAGIVVLLLVGLCMVIWYRKRKRGLEQGPPDSAPGVALGVLPNIFTYEELRIATDSFSNLNVIGQGGFGYVYKGQLSTGRVVAIKRLKAGSQQGEREFKAEVNIISRIHHRHLVSLVGYCIAGARRILVYDFIPNNTLDFHLHGQDRPTMPWPVRIKVALGSARGLAYLHEECNPRIIHRDVKASNILLDFDFEAKVADFGLAKFALDTDTHVSTRVVGTFGYLDPEYVNSGRVTEKSDVYAFGVVLLELITGRRPVDRTRPSDENAIVSWARPLFKQVLEDGKFDAMVDPKLPNYDAEEMTRICTCAAACVRQFARERPPMTQVVRALEGNLSLNHLNEGIAPGQSRTHSPSGSSDYDASQYQKDFENLRMMAWKAKKEQEASSVAPVASLAFNHPASSSGVKMAEDGHQLTPVEAFTFDTN